MRNEILEKLKLQEKNSGGSYGASWWSQTTEEEIISINPATEKPLASVYSVSEEDYECIVNKATQASKKWREIPAPKRGEVIRALGEALRTYKDPLGSLVSLEMGKSKQEGDGEVQEMIDMADFAVGQSRMLYGLSMHSERPFHRMYEQWHPLGVIGVISAFNFPVAVWSWNAFIAAICGNTVIWKPSPKTPLCSVAIQHICNQVLGSLGYEGIFSLVMTAKHDIVNRMADDYRLPLISFTGSTAVGRNINIQVAKRLGKALLELSGNNAIILDAQTDLSLAIPAIVFGAIGTCGQRCTTTRRLIIHESIYEGVIAALINAYKKITIGNPLDSNNLMGPLIDEGAREQFVKTVAKAQKEGGQVLFGGKVIRQPGFYVEPTIIAAQNHWEVVQQETFAPILYVMPYKNLDEAIAIQNHSAFGLSSALFTENLLHAEKFLSASGSDCGIANINIGTSGAEIGGAFGGEKNTGGGREAGSDAWKAYMRRQTTTVNWSNTLTLAQGIQFTV